MRSEKVTPSFLQNLTRDAMKLAKENRLSLQSAKDQVARGLGYEAWRELQQLAKRQGAAGLNSFKDVWDYLQAFRPSEAELKLWLDGSEDSMNDWGDGLVYRWWMKGRGVNKRVLTRSHLLPSSIYTDRFGRTTFTWHKTGQDAFDRDSGPAVIVLDDEGNVVWIEFWHNQRMDNCGAPTQLRIFKRDDDGRSFACVGTRMKNGEWKNVDFYKDA